MPRREIPFWLVMLLLAALLIAATLVAVSLKDTELRRNPSMERRYE
jgi:hypothetical protein